MKYRSFNEQLLIATALLINVFNDIIIDRRKHGFRDLSKVISLKDIAQKEIQIPCILGQRGHILRSLQNESGKYKLPLIILTNKGIKTDVPRMVDLHSDVFYQQDDSFSYLDPDDPLYKPLQLGRRRAQPIIMDFDMTIISKYKQDLDQILSNWTVFFRPDIYVKWHSPRNEQKIIDSQVTWSHQIGYNLPIQFNPTNVFSYSASTSFSFKTWLFPGRNVTQGKISQDQQAVIKKFKFFPNRGSWYDDQDTASGQKDYNDGDNYWSFGQIQVNQTKSGDQYDADDLYSLNKIQLQNIGDGAFWGVESWQQFQGTDQQNMKAGKYVVNNVFSQNHPQISGDPVLSKIKHNSLVGDFFSNNDKYLMNKWGKYQSYLLVQNLDYSNPISILNGIYFKRGKINDTELVSSDILFNTFNLPKQFQFGSNQTFTSNINIDYNIIQKKFTITSNYSGDDIQYSSTSTSSLDNGIQQQIKLQNMNIKYPIKFKFYRHVSNKMQICQNESLNKTKNVILFNKLMVQHPCKFLIQQPQFLDVASKMLNVFTLYGSMMNFKQIKKNYFQVYFEDHDTKAILKQNGLNSKSFLQFKFYYQQQIQKAKYQIFLNKQMYLVLKIYEKDGQQDANIYDYGVIKPASFAFNHAPLFEITPKQYKMLMGFNINASI